MKLLHFCALTLVMSLASCPMTQCTTRKESSLSSTATMLCDTPPVGNGFSPVTEQDPCIVSLVSKDSLEQRPKLQDKYPGRFCATYEKYARHVAIGRCAGIMLDGAHFSTPRHCFRGYPWNQLRVLSALTQSASVSTPKSYEIEQCRGFDGDIAICKIKNHSNRATATGMCTSKISDSRTTRDVIAHGHPWGLPLMKITGRIQAGVLHIDNFDNSSGSVIYDARSRDWVGLFYGNANAGAENTPECRNGCRTLAPCPSIGVKMKHIDAKAILAAWEQFRLGKGKVFPRRPNEPTRYPPPQPCY